MKVILDGVFNHCGSFNKWLDRECIYEDAEGYEKGAYISADSPYRTFFRFNEDMWPYNYHYDGWWGHDTLPKLNYEDSPLLFDYIMHIARKNGFHRRTMLTAGDLMWRQILVSHRSTITISGKSLEEMSRKQILKLLSWQSITVILSSGSEVTSGIR